MLQNGYILFSDWIFNHMNKLDWFFPFTFIGSSNNFDSFLGFSNFLKKLKNKTNKMKPELFLETNYEVQSCASDSSPASSCPSMIAFSEVSSLEEDECLVSAKQLLEYTIATSKRLSQFKLSTLLGI